MGNMLESLSYRCIDKNSNVTLPNTFAGAFTHIVTGINFEK